MVERAKWATNPQVMTIDLPAAEHTAYAPETSHYLALFTQRRRARTYVAGDIGTKTFRLLLAEVRLDQADDERERGTESPSPAVSTGWYQ